MDEIFHIAPTELRWGPMAALLVVIVPVFVLVGVLVVASLRGARTSTFELSPAGLRLRGDLYGRTIPAAQLVAADARRISITDGAYRPTMRTGGTAMPGYRAGWFKLRNGHKALLYVTDASRVVLVPTTAGYDVLLSVAETDAFVARLHAMAGTASASAPGALP